MYPYILSGSNKNQSIVGASVKGELHEMGIRMICDLIELEGYNTHYLGVSSSADKIIEFAKKKNAKIILLSVTYDKNLQALRELILQLKANDSIKDTKIIVGGRPFVINDTLHEELGADGYAVTLEDVKFSMENEQ